MGAAFIGFAVLTWSARNANDSDARRAIVLALVVSDVIGFIAALIAQLADVVNSLGWSTVAIYLLLALGFGYFQFAKPAD
jgi:Kef-type K+ transport system membrane component KefB